MADNWTKLKWRLQAIANNEANGGSSGVALIFVNLFLSGGQLIGWYKPQRIPLEPKHFDISLLPFTNTGDLDWLLDKCKDNTLTGTINRVLVVRDGDPIGWLDMVDI